MEPHGRDEIQENILEDIICGDDETSHFLNDSGEGDESLNAWKEAELGISDEGVKVSRQQHWHLTWPWRKAPVHPSYAGPVRVVARYKTSHALVLLLNCAWTSVVHNQPGGPWRSLQIGRAHV